MTIFIKIPPEPRMPHRGKERVMSIFLTVPIRGMNAEIATIDPRWYARLFAGLAPTDRWLGNVLVEFTTPPIPKGRSL